MAGGFTEAARKSPVKLATRPVLSERGYSSMLSVTPHSGLTQIRCCGYCTVPQFLHLLPQSARTSLLFRHTTDHRVHSSSSARNPSSTGRMLRHTRYLV